MAYHQSAGEVNLQFVVVPLEVGTARFGKRFERNRGCGGSEEVMCFACFLEREEASKRASRVLCCVVGSQMCCRMHLCVPCVVNDRAPGNERILCKGY